MFKTQSYKKATVQRRIECEYTIVNGVIACAGALLIGSPFALWLLGVGG